MRSTNTLCIWLRDALWDSDCKEKKEKNDVPHYQECRCVLPAVLRLSRFNVHIFEWWHSTDFVLPSTEFDRYELQTYEEVARMPPFQRKTLVLIGAQGVGRRSLKNRLIVVNPLRYGTTVPCECVHVWDIDLRPPKCSHLSPARPHEMPFLTFYIQLRHAVPEKRRKMGKTTVL